MPSLPASDDDPAGRSSQLQQSRQTWTYAYDWPPGVATGATLPEEDEYPIPYTVRTLKSYLAIAANLGAMAIEGLESGEFEAIVRKRFESIRGSDLHDSLFQTPQALAAAMSQRPPTSWSEYEELYRVWKAPDVVAFFHDTPRRQDEAFAWQRVAGVNPMVLARCTRIPDHFPVTEAIWRRGMGEGDSLAAALAEGRVYLADYAPLDGVPTGTTDGLVKHLGAPLALFAAEKGTGTLLPVAIQVGQDPSTSALFTPADGWRWWMARTAVQIADANVHEGWAHLGRTHMVMEAVWLAMHRQLAERHPLFVLLSPHVHVTAAINHSAKTSLIAPGGTVDRCFAPTIEAFASVVKKGLDTYPLDRTAPPDDLRDRGLMDLTAHPYRDDGLPIWNALRTYTDEVVALYYATDADVAGDVELQGFVRELSAADGGRLTGVPPANTRAELGFLLARLIWIAGPQHSAVNFTQFPNMGFPTNMPGAAYRPMPDASTPDEEAELLKMLPPWRIAIEDTTMVYLLSDVRESRLGDYGLLQFTDLRMHRVVSRFQAALSEIETATETRDIGRLMPYPHLLPSRILQSISI
ncbi:MAG: hypothetical protein H6738_22455 [Alphaproteobacteria bacterium]|nr:hypothetical protein [Alphaproteobacteria bacterium]MCB9699563.1 hypothetical protein [Alphaproteobacteria bacterium]